jgi:prephenate dehydratase
MFFIDFVVEPGKITYIQALEAIKPLTNSLKVFGVYAQGKHYEG